MIDTINSQNIFGLLKKGMEKKIKIEVLEKATSTNTLLKEAASEKAEGFVLIAGKQTAGKGRLGRSFYSPDDTGLYMSLLLKPSVKPEDAVLITAAAAVSVCEALEKAGVKNPQIKWVNDVFLNGKKVCGILTEGSFNSQNCTLDYVVLGIGINIYEPEGGFPEDIRDIAGAVFNEKKENLRNRIAGDFLNSFMSYYENITEKKYLSEYVRRNFVVGKNINIIKNGEVTPAKAIAVDKNCGLSVEYENGKKEVLNSGEISVRIKE